MNLDDVDLDEAMEAVVADMGRQAMAARGKRYAPKEPPPAEESAKEESESDETGMPTEGELAALLGE